MSLVRLSFFALLCVTATSLHAMAAKDEANRLIEQLGREDSGYLFDMHGNARAELRGLMALRFDATTAIEAAIDRLETDPGRAELVAALYGTLGFVKDPATIPWLERKLRSDHRERVHAHCLARWQTGIGIGFGNNPGFGEWPWLNGRARWIAFLIRAHDAEPAGTHRVELMNVLKGFDDVAVRRFFDAQRRTARDPREVLLVEAYLHERGFSVDDARIAGAIAELVDDPDNRALLLGTADALRHEAFVPYLIDTLEVAEPYISPPQFESRQMLGNITYVLDVDGTDWNAWYAKHRGEQRAQWTAAALAAFRERLVTDPAAAYQQFDAKGTYTFNDLAALPLIRDDLLPRREFASAVAGWINMTYAPALRGQLQPIAAVLARRPEWLEDWARNLLAERGFLPRRATSWADYVALSNMHL